MRKIPLVDLKAQYATIKDEIDEAISRVVGNTAFIGGSEVDEFEKEFARFAEAKYAIGCNSGTDAIVLALKGLGIGVGDEVITVSMTFIATAEAVTATGARPVFVDVDPDTLLMDVSQIEDAITDQTKAILPVHLYGQMADMEAICRIAQEHGLKVVEDAAQAHGARQNERPVGSFGEAGAFSFYPGKNLGAYGDAGAIVTSNEKLANWIKQAGDHGRLTKYEHAFEAISSRLDGLQAAILRAKLPHLPDWTNQRREIAAEYDRLIDPLDGVSRIQTAAGNRHVYHLYPLFLSNRDQVLERMKERGLGVGVHYPIPLHLQPAYRYIEQGPGTFPVTEKAAETLLSLPLYPELTKQDAGYIVETLADCLQ